MGGTVTFLHDHNYATNSNLRSNCNMIKYFLKGRILDETSIQISLVFLRPFQLSFLVSHDRRNKFVCKKLIIAASVSSTNVRFSYKKQNKSYFNFGNFVCMLTILWHETRNSHVWKMNKTTLKPKKSGSKKYSKSKLYTNILWFSDACQSKLQRQWK